MFQKRIGILLLLWLVRVSLLLLLLWLRLPLILRSGLGCLRRWWLAFNHSNLKGKEYLSNSRALRLMKHRDLWKRSIYELVRSFQERDERVNAKLTRTLSSSKLNLALSNARSQLNPS